MRHYFLKLSAIKGIIKDVEEITDRRDEELKLSHREIAEIDSASNLIIKKITEI